MDKQPPVSIFIVTYIASAERCDVLRRTCEGALAQRYPGFEVVVSDNGGEFSAHDALASIKDPRLKVFRHSENVGFAGNINRCLEHCSHDMIKPLCDDDLIHPDYLAQTVPFLDDDTLVVADVEKFVIGKDPDAIETVYGDPAENEVRDAGYGLDVWSLPYSPCCIPSAILFTRELFGSLGGFDGKTVTADWDFFIEACLRRKIVHVKRTLCFVGIWDGSLTEEMIEKPFFFPMQGLYTKFRVFHGKPMPAAERGKLGRLLRREIFREGLRLLKQPHKKAYREGFREYASRFYTLKNPKKDTFGVRPD